MTLRKIIYFLPFSLLFLFYLILGFGGAKKESFIYLILLLSKGKFAGSFCGIAVGISLIFSHSGQVLKEEEIGTALAFYFALCAVVSYKYKG